MSFSFPNHFLKGTTGSIYSGRCPVRLQISPSSRLSRSNGLHRRPVRMPVSCIPSGVRYSCSFRGVLSNRHFPLEKSGRMAPATNRASEAPSLWNSVGRSVKRWRTSSSLTEPILSQVDRSQKDYDDIEETRKGFCYAGVWSRLFFKWINPLLNLGREKPLDLLDIPLLADEDDANANYVVFEESWAKQKKVTLAGELPSIWKALWRCYWRPFCGSMALVLIWTCVFFVGPIVLFLLINYMNSERRSVHYGLVLVAIMFIGKCVEPLSKHQAGFWSQKLGLRMWAAVGSAVYRKTLMLSSRVRQERSVGEITNIMSNDLQRLLTVIWNIQQGLVLPFQIVVATVFLYQVVGLSMLAGLSSLIIVMGGNVLLVALMRTYRGGLLRAKDERMRVTVECLSNMKMVKLQSWDELFKQKIETLRDVERKWVSKFSYTWAFSIFVIWSAPLAVSAVTFFTMVLLGESLTPAKVFTALTTFSVIKEPVQVFPDIVSNLIQATVSLRRIRDFLCEEQVDENAVERVTDPASEFAVEIVSASFSWDAENDKTAIRDLSLNIRKGSCVAVCGGVGSSKSALLLSILGELAKLGGTAKVCGRMAYVAQSAWIQTRSIRDNILFGRPIVPERYQEALRVSGLEADLSQFPQGDETEIGERGVNLSGGQKQRIQLARAVYADADIYLLDDPFSAVDAHTAAHLFQACVRGALKDKTVILVSHQVEFLAETDQILVMRDGRIVQSGSYDQLVEEGKDFGSFVEALQDSLTSVTQAATSNAPPTLSRSDNTLLSAPQSQSSKKIASVDNNAAKEQFIKAEERETGQLSSKILWNYATKVYKGLFLVVLVAINVLTYGLQVAGDSWLAGRAAPGAGKHENLVYVGIYALFTGGGMLSVLMRSTSVAFVGVATAQAFFVGMLRSIFRAPMSFIDSTPLGRILSRSSTDQSALELDLPNACANSAFNLVGLLGTAAVTGFVTPPLIILLFPLGCFFVYLQRYWMTSARELSRLTAISEAPIYLHVSESVAGASTIRAWQDQQRFMDIMAKRFEHYQRCSFHFTAAVSWFAFRLQSIVAAVVSGAGLLLVFLPEGTISPGMAGLSLSYALGLSSVLGGLVMNASIVENKMVSVERVSQYTELPSEAPTEIPDKRPALDWPNEGQVELKNVQLRYRQGAPLVLKGITCVMRPREKVGIVGRTGSGKSSLIQALFRLVELSEGSIIIDGVDVSTIGLADLRSRLSVIPQEPTIFEGSVRTNLDPFNRHTDRDIWETLENCMIADAVREKPEKLNSSVSSQGENWSVGQRQLLCLARALLKKARILVLDEATASLDISTDAVIQRAIRRQFAHCTVINVAHRIPTVIDSDRVLVFDAGYLKENDSPENLLADENSLFSKLVHEYTSRSGSV